MTRGHRPVISRAVRGLVVALALTPLGGTADAGAAALPIRTTAISVDSAGRTADGASSSPVIAATGRIVAFESEATNLLKDPRDPDQNGPMRDIFVANRESGDIGLVSRGVGRVGADGPSFEPALSSQGFTIVFSSSATNLVEGDSNSARDVFMRPTEGSGLQIVSVGADGGPADNASSQPDVSGDGRMVVFSSLASNIVPGDHNGRADVFVRDTVTGVIQMISKAGEGSSDTPSISADGRFVSFFSTDPALVDGDTNGRGDVFVRKIAAGTLGPVTRVSVNSGEDQQNLAVEEPFSQVSDVSGDGRYVAFDSDATNLALRDRNNDTDVFVRDRRSGTTTRVSVSSAAREGDNDSFNPTITPNGRYVAFQSFAETLASVSGAREDVFLHDRRLKATSVISVGAEGQARGMERVRQNLQRPMVADSGANAVFTSTASNLLIAADDSMPRADDNGFLDVFLRRLSRPLITEARVRSGRLPRMTLKADDPRATRFQCRLDGGILFECKSGTRALVGVRPGRHVLTVRAGGTGMLYSAAARRLSFTVPR